MPSGPPALLVPTEHLALSPSSKAACDLLNEELGNWEAFLYGELPASSRQAWWDDFGHGSGEVL